MANRKTLILLEEYRAITDLHKHFDIMNLSMTSIIASGVIALWGFMLKEVSHILPIITIMLATIIFFVLTTWLRYTSIHRVIVVRKLTRSVQIEKMLNMYQNRRFSYNDPIRSRRRGPGAHMAEIILYWLLVSLGVGVMIYNSMVYGLDLQKLPNLYILVDTHWYAILIAFAHFCLKN